MTEDPPGLRLDDQGNIIEARALGPPPKLGRPASVVAAAVLTAASALFWLAITGIQAGALMRFEGGGSILLVLWNAVFVAVYGWIAWSVWSRSELGCSWALGTHAINVLWSGYQAYDGVSLLFIAIPIHLAGVVAAWFALKAVREHQRALLEHG